MSHEDRALDAYIICALWSSIGEDGSTPLDNIADPDDVDDRARDDMREDVRAFIQLCMAEGLELAIRDAEQTGHDFWLTRNHHGAGFWDRGLGDVGDKLTKLAQSFGSSDLYVGDDGRVYVS